MIKMYYKFMRLNRFIGNFDLSKKETEIINPENIKQIKGVLRLEIGDKIILGDGKGMSAEAIILSMSLDKIVCSLEKIENKNELNREVNLYLAILKKENFELAVQKATEVGVSNIIPIVTDRTIKTGLNMDRIEKIIREASEQSGRNTLPTLSPILNFPAAIAYGSAAEEKIIFHLVQENYQVTKNAKSVSIFIGPEGGFTEKEISLAEKAGYTVSSLGALTLRGETAAIVATYRAVEGI
jgi:16S rRNA (uracil1498-N3)-methyltransferase